MFKKNNQPNTSALIVRRHNEHRLDDAIAISERHFNAALSFEAAGDATGAEHYLRRAVEAEGKAFG